MIDQPRQTRSLQNNKTLAIYGVEPAQDDCGQEVDPKPDGPRYAACGDAVTASVAEWIGGRLMDYEARRVTA